MPVDDKIYDLSPRVCFGVLGEGGGGNLLSDELMTD